MARMVRKQIYIEERQEDLLKRQARSRRASEAQLIREAIDRQVAGGYARSLPDPHAWEEAVQFMRSLAQPGNEREPAARTWTRDELYEERLSRRETGTR